jgi:hypothetical protein
MKQIKLGQDPAFPDVPNGVYPGMSRRFYAACAAMQGMLSDPNSRLRSYRDIISDSLQVADEFLKQENEAN